MRDSDIAILLTPELITIGNEWKTITPKETFSAITGGASIIIQISINDKRLKKINKEKDIFEQLEHIFPKESVEGNLIDLKGNTINLPEKYFSISDFTLYKENSIRLMLTTSGPMPIDIKFKSVRLKSKEPITNVKVFWKNNKL